MSLANCLREFSPVALAVLCLDVSVATSEVLLWSELVLQELPSSLVSQEDYSWSWVLPVSEHGAMALLEARYVRLQLLDE